jgi:hypothetical protein
MGTQSVSEVVWRVRQLIHDSAGARWDDTEMLKWFNDGLAEVVLLKPTANSQRLTLSLVVGTVQELPAGSLLLLRITHNASGAGVRLVDQDRLDASAPTWRVVPSTVDIQHYMYEPEIPKEFQVYPPNTGAGSVEATVSIEPTRVTSVSDLLPLDDIYIPTLVDYLLYRAYSKHSKFSGNETRANNAYQRFGQALGVKMAQETSLDPNITNADAGGVE